MPIFFDCPKRDLICSRSCEDSSPKTILPLHITTVTPFSLRVVILSATGFSSYNYQSLQTNASIVELQVNGITGASGLGRRRDGKGTHLYVVKKEVIKKLSNRNQLSNPQDMYPGWLTIPRFNCRIQHN